MALGLFFVLGAAYWLARDGNHGSEEVAPTGAASQSTPAAAERPAPLAPLAGVAASPPAEAPAEAPARMPAERVGAEPAGPGIVLNVSVIDGRDQPIQRGSIECLYGSPGLETAPDVSRKQAAIAGPRTTIVLPMTAREALLTASVPDYPAAQLRLKDLGRKKGRRLGDGERVEHDATICLIPSSRLGPGLSGRVFVDGVERIPAGLTVQAQHGSAAEGSVYQGPRLGVIDTVSGTYRFDALPAGNWNIEAKSEETIPRWTPVQLAGRAPAAVVDLHLDSGSTLVVHVKDARSKQASPDRAIRLDYWVPTHKEPGRVIGSPVRIDARSDAEGVCEFRSLPTGIRLALRESSESEDEPAHLELILAESDPREVHRDLWIGGTAPTWSEYWGEIPEGLPEGEDELVVNARDTRGGSPYKFGSVTESGWSIAFPVMPESELWLARSGERLTGRAKVTGRPGRQGPIHLQPIRTRPFRLSWTNAPLGFQLVVGKTRVTLTESAGSVEIDKEEDAGLVLRVEDSDKSFLFLSWVASALEDALAVDLMGDHQHVVRLVLNDDAPKASSPLLLAPDVRPQGVSDAFVVLNCSSGQAGPFPLFDGANYFSTQCQLDDGKSKVLAVVTGRVEVSQGSAAGGRVIDLDWRGKRVSAADLGLAGHAGFEVTHCGGIDLSASVVAARRRFLLKDLDWPFGTAGSDAAPTFFFDTEKCRLKPVDN
jgi:hypothetical protein